MTMHMVHPGLTTINTSGKRKKPSAKQQRAKAEHDEWLRKQGVHSEQLAAKSNGRTPRKLSRVFEVKPEPVPCSNGFAPAGAKKSVFDSAWKKTYEDDPSMAERERAALRQAEMLKSRLMPLYNKGPVQLLTNGSSLKDGNGRGRT